MPHFSGCVHISGHRWGSSEEFGTHLGLLSSCRIQPIHADLGTLFGIIIIVQVTFRDLYELNIWSTSIKAAFLMPCCCFLIPLVSTSRSPQNHPALSQVASAPIDHLVNTIWYLPHLSIASTPYDSFRTYRSPQHHILGYQVTKS